MISNELQMVPGVIDAWRENGRVDPTRIRPRFLEHVLPQFSEEWRFGPADYSLTGVKQKLVITQNPAGENVFTTLPNYYPDFGANYVQTQARTHSGLQTPLPQTNNETVYVIWQFDDASNRRIFGNLVNTSSGEGMDLSWQTGGNGLRVNTRLAAGVDAQQFTLPGTVANGDYLLVFISHSPTQRIVYLYGGPNHTEALAIAPAARNYVLGEIDYFQTTWSPSQKFAGCGRAPLALSVAEMDAAAIILKAAMARRGIALHDGT